MSRKTSVAHSRRNESRRVASRKPFWIAISSRHATARDVVVAFIGPVRRRLFTHTYMHVYICIYELKLRLRIRSLKFSEDSSAKMYLYRNIRNYIYMMFVPFVRDF